jgi:iron complex outermembrane receptor protein
MGRAWVRLLSVFEYFVVWLASLEQVMDSYVSDKRRSKMKRKGSLMKWNALYGCLLIALSAHAADGAGPALGAQQASDPSTATKDKDGGKSTKQLQELIVTGTHAANRTSSSSLAPVDVLSSKDLQRTGSTDLGSALTKLEPSLNFPMPADADGSAAQRPISMRGLSPDMVLVLIDGKRYHSASYVNTSGIGYGTAPVDLNTIPLSMVDHIEVLRDGAAALYGSDAIAGVVNIVLKKGGTGGSVQVSGGRYTGGGGRQGLATANFGVALGDKGWVRFDLEDGYTGVINRSSPNRYMPQLGTPGQGSTPSIHHKSFNINGQYDITSDVQLYFTSINTLRDSVEAMNYRYPYLKYKDYIGSGGTTIGSAAHGYSGYPEYALYPNGYQPALESKTQDNQFTLGLRGTIGDGWHWDLAGNYGRNKLSFHTIDTINKAWYLDTGTAPTDYYDGTFTNKEESLTLDMSKDFNVSWLPNSVTLAFGAQYLREAYGLSAGDEDSYYGTSTVDSGVNSGTPASGAQGFTGYSPNFAGSWSRHSLAEYISLETNVTDKLGMSLAVRHEDYSDFGSTVNAALSARYDFTDTFALRGSFSTGFKAPSLAQSYFSEVASAYYTANSTNGLAVSGLYNGGIFPVSNTAAQLLGAQALKPERSKNFTIGTVWSPIDNLTLTADLYQINIKNRITLSGSIPTTNANIVALLAAQGVTDNYASIQYMFNGFNTRTQGVDVVADYLYPMGNGARLDSTLTFNFTRNKITHYNDPPTALVALDSTYGLNLVSQLYSRDLTKGVYEHGSPQTKLVFAESYVQGPWAANATLTRYGRITSYGSTYSDTLSSPLYPNGQLFALDQTYAPRWLLDLSGSYNYKSWTFSLGVDNVFNTYPSKNDYANNTSGVTPYPVVSPFGFYGRYVYGKVSFNW